MERTVSKISLVEKRPVELFCRGNKCKQTCFISKVEKHKYLQIRCMFKQNISNCYLIYQLRSINGKLEACYENDLECLVSVNLKYKYNNLYTVGILDTGAQVSCVPVKILEDLIPRSDWSLEKCDKSLVSAGNQKLDCLGKITLCCVIKDAENFVEFYVLTTAESLIFGLDAIRLFQITIKPNFNNEKNMAKLNAILYDVDQNIVKKPQTVFLSTPQRLFEINNQKIYDIILQICCKKDQIDFLLYQKVHIYDCTCLINKDKISLCEECNKQGPMYISVIEPPRICHIKYRPVTIHNLVPKLDYFQIVLIETGRISQIRADPPSFVYNAEKGLTYEPGGFCEETGLNTSEIYPVNNCEINHLDKVDIYYPEIICSVCKLSESNFCNFKNNNCLAFIRYKKSLNSDENSSKCILINLASYKKIKMVNNDAICFTELSWNQELEQMMQYLGFDKSIINANLYRKNTELLILECKNTFCFVLLGKITLLNIESLLAKIACVIREKNIQTLNILEFNNFEISNELLCNIFHNIQIKILIYYEIKFAEQMSINKINFKIDQNIQSNIIEDKGLKSQLNVILNDQVIKDKMLKLCMELSKTQGHLNNLWSAGSHDIGMFRQGIEPFYPIKFKFPLKPEYINVPPTSVKTTFINPRLQEPAKQMLQSLEEAGIIQRAYSIYNAKTHWLPKPPPELSLQQWIEQGLGTEKNYVAGTPNKKSPITLRMVHHFVDLNERTINAPIYQPSTTEQLRRISSKIKFLSLIDVTACFFSLCIDEESSQMTGFDSGIESCQRYRYLRVPMGAGISKTLQDAALLHALSGLDNFIIYSDNIVVLSEDKIQHFEHVKLVLQKLRLFGFKAKLSKASFFINGMVRLYGHILNLAEGTLYPETDKINALRSKAVPKTKKELKSFIGGLQFYAQLLPLAGKEMATLHEATRGSNFCWGKAEQLAYEAIMFLLTKTNLISVYRGDELIPYHVSCDSSDCHTSYVIFQIDKSNHHRAISYGLKTWGDEFRNCIPEYRELQGIVHCLKKLQAEYEHKLFPVTLYTDNLPLVLMNVAARFNRKIARMKLFIETLNWLQICWTPGTSGLIALSDYYSRQREDLPAKLKQPEINDLIICNRISNKIDKNKIYNSGKSLFLIDSLIELPQKEFDGIKSFSAYLNKDGKLRFECIDQSNEMNQSESPHLKIDQSGSTKLAASLSTVLKVKTRSQSNYNGKILLKSNPEGTEQTSCVNEKIPLSNNKLKEGSNLKITISDQNKPTESIMDIGNKMVTKTKSDMQSTINHQIEINEPSGDTLRQKQGTENNQMKSLLSKMLRGHNVEVSKSSLRNSNKDDFNLEQCNDTYFSFCDLQDLVPARESNIVQEPQQHKVEGNSSLARWYRHFVSCAKYLSIDRLAIAINNDPYWNEIKKLSLEQGKYIMNDKTFIMFEGVLICQQKMDKNINIFKLVLPGVLAYDTVLTAHRQFLHIKNKKLINSLNTLFEIKDLHKLVKHITAECFICGLNAPQPAGGYRPPLPKNPILIREKATVWAIDELTLLSSETGNAKAGFNKILVAVCCFSHFVVIEPLYEQLTSEVLLRFVQTKIIQIFGPPNAIVTDGDKKISSELIKYVCGFLGIYKLESLAYSPRGNLSELSNKLIIDMLRNATMSNYVDPKYFHIILTNVVYLVNSLTFTNSEYISPFLLMFGKKPKSEVLQIFGDSCSEYISKHEYLEQLIRINEIYTKLRIAMMDKRKYMPPSNKNQNYYNKIVPGSIVIIRNPEKVIHKKDHKLRPLYKGKFIVIRRSASCAYLRPLENIYLERFLKHKESRNFETLQPDFCYKVEISLLKLVSHMTMLHSNKTKEYYQNFVDYNLIPEPQYYFSKDGKTGLLRSWDEIFDNNELIDEIFEAEQIIMNKYKTSQNIRSILNSTYKKQMIKEISNKFKSLQNKPILIVKSYEKKVTFNTVVTMRRLIKPNIIYFCQKPVYVEITNEEDAKPTLRYLKSSSKTYYCSCKKCSKSLKACYRSPCSECFGDELAAGQSQAAELRHLTEY